jgi:cold shock protein
MGANMQGDFELSERVDGGGGAVRFGEGGHGMSHQADETGEPISGRVKWFDMVKGYGFVTPDDGGGDILVHYNLLGPLGRKSLPEGAGITVLTRQGGRGRQAAAILAFDISTAIGPDPDRAQDRNSSRVDPLDFLEQAGDFERVQVRWFNRAKGYGFLLRSDGVTQVFVHMETVRRAGFENLLPGHELEARVFDGPKGALAVHLRDFG